MAVQKKKAITTVLIIAVSVSVFIAFMFIKFNDEKTIHPYTGILFGIIPAIMINKVWNKTKRKNH